mmetsp:Transcript_87726/g.253005  ORF Transcript_87726/g.253005 Transcript_87726/m.253005 type:complete len:205 (+) Transcript_87726:632-1246(+)
MRDRGCGRQSGKLQERRPAPRADGVQQRAPEPAEAGVARSLPGYGRGQARYSQADGRHGRLVATLAVEVLRPRACRWQRAAAADPRAIHRHVHAPRRALQHLRRRHQRHARRRQVDLCAEAAHGHAVHAGDRREALPVPLGDDACALLHKPGASPSHGGVVAIRCAKTSRSRHDRPFWLGVSDGAAPRGCGGRGQGFRPGCHAH